jgi:hypothetical protein
VTTPRGIAALAFSLIISQSVWAGTVDRTVTISSGNFVSSLSLGGNLSVSGQNTVVRLSGDIAGTPVGLLTGNINLPQQTIPLTLSPNPTPVNNPVSGNFVLRGEDNYKAVGPDPNDGGDYQLVPGSDGLFDDGDSANSAMDLIVASTNVNLLNQNFQSTQAVINGSVGIPILGLTTVNFDARIIGNVDGNASATFVSNAPSNEISGVQDNSTFPDGQHPYINPSNPNANATPDGVDNLGVQGLFIMPGDFNASISGGLNGRVEIDAGIFGTITQNLDDLVNLNEVLTEAFALIGNLDVKQIPTTSLLSDDLLASMGFDFAPILGANGLSFPVTLSGTQVFDIDFDVPVNLGIGSFTLDGDFTGSVSYTLDATITIAPPSYTAAGSLTNAVNVPEANTLVLIGAIGLGSLAIGFYRRRKVA